MSSKKTVLGDSKITGRFQLTVPKAVRQRFGFKVGDLVAFMLSESGELIIKKIQI